MATSNKATIRSTVRLRGDYETSGKFTDAYLDTEIQAAFAETYELIADVNEGWWDTSVTVVTVASTAFVALPADCWRVSGVDLLDGGSYTELRQVPTGERNRYDVSTLDEPQAYRLTARGVDLFPTPNAVYTLRITYTPMCPTLAETTLREFYNHWEEHVIAGALVRLAEREERPLSEPMAELARQAQRIIKGASRRRQAEPEYLVMREEWDPEDCY